MLDEKLQKTKAVISQQLPVMKVVSGGQIRSVDDFCPDDGSNLDKSFLEDILDGALAGRAGALAIDSDSEAEHANPLVAQFDEDYIDAVTSTPVKGAKDLLTQATRTNPLAAKVSKHRSSSEVEIFNMTSITSNSRRSSSSSLDLKVGGNDQSSSFVEFDSDSSKLDSKIRRSPEGIEDSTAMTPAACTASSIDEEVGEKKKKHKKKSKDKDKSLSEKKEKREKKSSSSKKKKSKDVISTSEDDLVNLSKQDAYEMIWNKMRFNFLYKNY